MYTYIQYMCIYRIYIFIYIYIYIWDGLRLRVCRPPVLIALRRNLWKLLRRRKCCPFFSSDFFSLRAGRRLWRVFSTNLADIGLTCVIFPAFGDIFLDGRSSDFFWHGFRPGNCCKFRILTLPSLPGFQKKQFRLWTFELGAGLAAVQLSIFILCFCPRFFLKITAKQRLNQFPCSSPTVSAQDFFWKSGYKILNFVLAVSPPAMPCFNLNFLLFSDGLRATSFLEVQDLKFWTWYWPSLLQQYGVSISIPCSSPTVSAQHFFWKFRI